MVSEFAELQGTMGEQYAQIKGESELISRGIREHYHPRFMQDRIPQNIETIAVALADKLDMLATAFSLNIIPTGSADPYALRRMSQGVVSLILEAQLLLSIHDLNIQALKILEQQQNLGLDIPKITSQLSEFFELRQRFFMQEAKIRSDVIEALLDGKNLLPLQQSQLGIALNDHLETPMFKRAVAAIVRANNITKNQVGILIEKIDESSLDHQEEKNLFHLVQTLQQATVNWESYCQTLFDLEPTITAFFDQVLVMDKDTVKQNNRLSLCQSIAHWSQQYMNLSKIVFPK